MFIDEGGTFIPQTGWGVVCSLAIPHKEVGPSRREIVRASRDWPRHKGELKGGALELDQLNDLVDILFRHDALLHACAIDVSREDPGGLDHHKKTQAEDLTKHLTSEHHAHLVAEVWRLRKTLERMPQQLYLQYVLLSELVWSTSEEAALYFSQRRPRELTEFEWTIDAKDPRRITTYEKWWQNFLGPALESKSRRQPMICVDDPSFNYSFFDRSFATEKEMWHPDEPPKTVDGYNIKKMTTDRLAFVDSRDELLIQAVDILASFLRRLLAREIKDDAVAKALGRLQIKRNRGEQLQTLRLLTGPLARIAQRAVQDHTEYELGGTQYDQTDAAISDDLTCAAAPAACRCWRRCAVRLIRAERAGKDLTCGRKGSRRYVRSN